MADGKIIKNIETRVSFTNDEIREMLQKAAGAPEGAKGALSFDDDSFYGDLEITWWERVQEDRP